MTLAALVVTHVLLLFNSMAVARWVDLPWYAEDEFLGWVFALPMAQAGLWALWISWGGRRWVRRIGLTLPLVATTAMATIYLGMRPSLRWSTTQLICLIYCLQLPLVLIASLIARIWGPWRLADADSAPGPAREFTRFGPRRFVLWAAMLTALFVAGRWLVECNLSLLPVWPRAAGVPVLVAGSLFLFGLAVWAAFIRDSGLLSVAFASLLAMVFTAAEVVFIELCRIPVLISDVFVWALNGWHFIIVLGSLLALRVCGFRRKRSHAGRSRTRGDQAGKSSTVATEVSAVAAD